MVRKTEFQRFVEKIRPPKDPIRDCWEWIGCKNAAGYGSFRGRGMSGLAHRRSLEMHTLRPVPVGMDTDHLCRNRACVNPLHLEIVSRRENVSRGLLGAMRPGKTSRHVGVSWCSNRKRWVAVASLNGKLKNIGRFRSEDEAKAAYDAAISGADVGGCDGE